MLPVNVCLEAFNFTVPPYVHWYKNQMCSNYFENLNKL